MGETDNSEVKNNSKKSSLVIIVVILAFIVGVFVGYIIFDNVMPKKTNDTETKETENKQDNNDNNEVKEQEIAVNKADVDAQLESYQLPLNYAFERFISGENVTYNQELLDNDAKFNFAWGVAELEKLGKYIPEDEVNPDLGNYYIDYNSFKSVYKRLYGEEFDGTLATNRNSYTLQGEILYGTSYTGFTLPIIYLETNKVVKEGNKYTITIDTLDREAKDKKDCQLQIIAEKVNDNYQFKSIKLIK